MSFDVLDDPPATFVEEMRRRFPTERETDRQLVRKLHRRGGPAHVPATLAQLEDGVCRLLADEVGGDIEVANARWFTGGASKIQMGFDLRWVDPRRGTSDDRLMVRMDPAESHNATSKQREFEMLRAVAGVVPAPRAFWVDDDARWFPEPALIYSLIDGVAKPSTTATGSVSGMGINFGPRLREQLAPQFVEHLAAIHTVDLATVALDSCDVPAIGTSESARWELNRARRIWEEDRGEDHLVMEVAAAWLERNAPTLDRVSLVHGDFRSGNFLFDEAGGRITGWLDWERGHLGDRHRDLAWAAQPSFGHYAEDGDTFLVCGLLSLDAFCAEYERASGLAVDRERLRWYRVLSAYQLVASSLGTIYRVVRLGKTHQDVLLARAEGIYPALVAELATLLDEVV